MSIIRPVTPETATPDHLAEVVDAYAKYLMERCNTEVTLDPARIAKIEGSMRALESTLAYWIGCLLDANGETDPVTDEVRWQIRELREKYADQYTIPDIEANAFKLSESRHKLARKSARASVERRQVRTPAPQPPTFTPVAPPPAPASTPTTPAATPLETAMARTFKLTIEEYRAKFGKKG